MRCRRTPTILQLEATECGATALGIVLAAHGLWVPLEELRATCGVSRNGARAGNLLRAARTYGMEARGFRGGMDDLRQMPLPAIAFVNLNHFLVVERFSRDTVFVNDPASGHRRVRIAEFTTMYSGIVLTITPTPAFTRGGTRPCFLPRLASWLRESRQAAAYIVASGLSLAIFAILIPGFSRVFIDNYLVDGQTHWVPWLIATMLTCAVLQGGLLWLRGQLRQRMIAALETRIAARFVWRMLRLPIAFHARRFPGSLASRLSMAPQVAKQANLLGTDLLVESVSVLLFLTLMARYSWLLASVVAVCAASNIAIFLLVRRKLEDLSRQVALGTTRLTARTMLGLQMMESLKAGGGEAQYFAGWAGQHALVATQQQHIARVEALLAAMPASIGQAATALVLVLGGLLVMQGELTLGMLVAFQLLHSGFNAPVEALLRAGQELQKARGDIEQLDDVLAHIQAPEFDTSADVDDGERLAGQFSLRGLSFGYGPLDPPLIQDFFLDIAPGQRVAIVGASGSGKTTIGRLASGLLEPWTGEILLDGRPINNLPRPLLRRSLAVVDQDIVLFEGTVRDNISLWNDDLPDTVIYGAAADAEIHDVILARTGGYNAPVTEAGNFSGGQRQRIEIARALVTNPSVLVLDEATSALDPIVEQRVMENLRRRGCTCLIVAHRLSTIRDCDEIILLQHGRVLERGDHGTLMAKRGAYAALIEA